MGRPDDPVLRQVEVLIGRGSTPRVPRITSTDPLGEDESSPVPGVLHKYVGRVLLVTTGACPVHCRYCFRRHFAYTENSLSGERLEAALAYIRADATVVEVILSGGDPLSLSDDRLSALSRELADISHVRRLRVHTRWPVVSPSRVGEELLDWMTATRLAPVMVIHANHPNEIDADVAQALRRVIGRSIPVFNQAVLLRGVNDSAAVLGALSERLFACGVTPYYLNLLDPVAGASHFAVPEEEGRELVRQLEERLPGYLVPRLVREIPGAGSKRRIDR